MATTQDSMDILFGEALSSITNVGSADLSKDDNGNYILILNNITGTVNTKLYAYTTTTTTTIATYGVTLNIPTTNLQTIAVQAYASSNDLTSNTNPSTLEATTTTNDIKFNVKANKNFVKITLAPKTNSNLVISQKEPTTSVS